MEVQKVLVQYSYLKDPKQSQGVDNDWIKRGISFPSNVHMEELVTKISEKTKIPREYLEIHYKIPNSVEDEWLLLKDEDDFQVMMGAGNMVQIQAIYKPSDGEEEHGSHTTIQPNQVVGELDDQAQTSQHTEALKGIRREADLIKVVVDNIFQKTKRHQYKVAEQPVGVDSHVAEVMKILNSKTSCDQDIVMVGIVGMGGICKTTIAKSHFNQLSAPQLFDGSCFLQNTRENWLQKGGQHLLKQKLLSDILKMEVEDARGDDAIKQRLQQKRVLLVLDDIDSIEQLKVLAGGRDWFGKGSRIIITTRDLDLLIKHQVREDEIYRAKKLSDDQSLELFSFHAFRSKEPPANHKLLSELSKEFVATTGGLPLALKVLGSELFCAGDEVIWKELLEKRKEVPHDDIQQCLRLSFDKLDKAQKSIFLDIACSYQIKGNLEYATHVWEGQKFFPRQ